MWDLLAFTMQMVLVLVTGHVLATAPPIFRLIERLAAWPQSGRGAVALVTLFALASSWFNWGFSLIFSAVLAREIARRRPDADYRALGAASLLGLGSIWAQGLSGSAALQMATPSALPSAIRDIVAHHGLVANGIIDFRHTIFLWQSLLSVAIEIVVVTLVMWRIAPRPEHVQNAAALGVSLAAPPPLEEPPSFRPALEHSFLLLALVAALGAAAIGRAFYARGLQGLTLNNINLALLSAGMLLHRTPARLMHAVREATPSVWSVILQFPFYAGIAAIIVSSHLHEKIAHFFVSIATPRTFPALMASYSALLGLFVPSGGSKWIIEAPYVMQAAHDLHVHVGWVVACYDLGEALANLIQPFWMLPVLALLGLRARDVMGYTFLIFLVLTPLVLLMTTVLGATLPYPLG